MPDPKNLDQMAAFYQQPNVEQFIQAATETANKSGGGANASIGATVWALEHAKDYGLTDADLHAMFDVQSQGHFYDPTSKTMKPIDSKMAKVGKFVLGYVAPALVTAGVVGPAIAGAHAAEATVPEIAIESTVPEAVVPTTTASILTEAAKLAKDAKTAKSIYDTTKDLGKSVSDYSSGTGNTRRADLDTNVLGQSAYETELMNRAKLEADQRKEALKDVYRQGASTQASPYNPAGAQQSPAYTQALSALEQQGMNRLQTAPQYGTDVMPKLPPYVPTKPGTVEKVSSYVGPALSTVSTLANLYKDYESA